MSQLIQSMWIGESLSRLEQLSIQSFLNRNHPYHLYVYTEISSVPHGVVLKDANEIISESNIFTYPNGSYAGFANLFRYWLLFKKGNWWVDTDLICLKNFDFKENIVMGRQCDRIVNSACLKFPPGDPLLKKAVQIAENPNKIQPGDGYKTVKLKLKRRFLKGNKPGNLYWGETGPLLLTRLIKDFGYEKYIKPENYFYPVPYQDWECIFNGSLDLNEIQRDDFYALHLWNEMYRCRPDFDKNATFPEDSIIEKLKKQQGVFAKP